MTQISKQEINFKLHERQGEILNDPARFKVVCCGRRWGKTVLALIALLVEALSQRDARLYYVAPSYRQAKNISWNLLKSLMRDKPADIKYNEAELIAYFPLTNSTIELKGAENKDSLRGSGLGTKHHKGGLALVIDEFASIYDRWEVWHAVLRPQLSDHQSSCLFISTPAGKDSFYNLFLKGQRNEEGWKSWQFPTSTNPYIADEEIDEARRDTTKTYFAQEYEAQFTSFYGLCWPEFTQKDHVVPAYDIDPHLERVGAIDTAISGVTGCLKAAVDTEGRFIIYDEYYEKDKRVEEIAPEVKDDDVTWYIDPAATAQKVMKQGKVYNLMDEYREHGIEALYAEKNVSGGINRVGEAFKNNKIKIFSKCTNLIWELERYHFSETRENVRGEAEAQPYKKHDHLCDCLRYLIMSREYTRVKQEKKQPGLFAPAYDWDKPKEEVFI